MSETLTITESAVRPLVEDGTMSDRVKDACEACLAAHKGDCSGFARAVSRQLGVNLQGSADQIVDALRDGEGWTPLPDGQAAAARAKAGNLVLAGLKGSEQRHPDPHGHVGVVVDGSLNRAKYPSAYWGSLHGKPGRNETINFAWIAEDRDRVSYSMHPLPSAAEPCAPTAA